MSTPNKKTDDERVMASNPLEEDDDEILSNSFYRPGPPQGSSQTSTHKESSTTAPKPLHYKTISISLYVKDIEHIDTLVRELKRRGYTKMNRSALIRFALDTVDINALPPQY